MSILAAAAISVALLQNIGADIAAREATRLDACIARIDVDAEEAYEDALAWSFEGNRPGARQCVALALIALGQEDEGAARLEELANASDGGTMEQRALYLTQAGNAWLVAGAPEAAVVTLTNALKIMPNEPNLLVDRASAQILLGKWPEAIKDLDKALEALPGLAAAHQLRAEARLNMNDLEPALADVKAAMAAEPDNIDTLVLRGRIREAIRLSEVRIIPPQAE
ncbi:MAG: tetratricopeptide repeat protein [Alphaproteobacteria bacterium]|nr:tetratricopeptide repeat protein [Alphaproteobacteria bacterium]MBU2142377.1 tetratricopeptide repeat protein [Alphaproteobacteria bacterium]MBU2197513.1 tetratricopeptide repeat protein [Alphaproteobacteria bacterium]